MRSPHRTGSPRHMASPHLMESSPHLMVSPRRWRGRNPWDRRKRSPPGSAAHPTESAQHWEEGARNPWDRHSAGGPPHRMGSPQRRRWGREAHGIVAAQDLRQVAAPHGLAVTTGGGGAQPMRPGSPPGSPHPMGLAAPNRGARIPWDRRSAGSPPRSPRSLQRWDGWGPSPTGSPQPKIAAASRHNGKGGRPQDRR